MEYFKVVIAYRASDDEGKLKKFTKQIIVNSKNFAEAEKDAMHAFSEAVPTGHAEFEMKSISKVHYEYIFGMDNQNILHRPQWYKAVVKTDSEKFQILICGDNNISDISNDISERMSNEVIIPFGVVQVTSTNILTVELTA
jgi:hypothetical protein|nr:MAG TPA: protein of unknown function (DUF4494) [Caudoviricetes sp.]